MLSSSYVFYILTILIRHSTLFEFILADPITFGTQASNSTHFEAKLLNITDVSAANNSSISSATNRSINDLSPVKSYKNLLFKSTASNSSIGLVITEAINIHQIQSDESSHGMSHIKENPINVTEHSSTGLASQLFRAPITEYVDNSTEHIKQNANNVSNVFYGKDHGFQPKQQADEPELPFGSADKLPEKSKPTMNATYFVVAVMGGAKIWSRTLSRTLTEIEASLDKNSSRAPLKPIYVDLPASGR